MTTTTTRSDAPPDTEDDRDPTVGTRCVAICCANRRPQERGRHDPWWDDYGTCSRRCANFHYGEEDVETPQALLDWPSTPVEPLAETLCRQDTSWDHHDRTDGFPCTACKARAAVNLTDADSLADWLGSLPEASNVTDMTDEATTMLTISVEALANLLAPMARGTVR